MKKLATVAVAIFATFAILTVTVTSCEDSSEREYYERLDRLYKECLDAGGSFTKSTDGWSTDYSCILPGTENGDTVELEN